MALTIYDLKPKFQNLLRPLCRALAARGVTANQVTVAAVLLSLAGGVAVYFAARCPALLLSVPLVLFLRMALNAIDGMLAREHGMKSALGAVLNEMGDAVSDTVLYLPFAFIPGVSAGLVVLLVIGSLLIEMMGVVAVQIGASRRYDGPFGKSDRAFFFGLIALLLGCGLQAGPWLKLLLAAALALSLLTLYNRARRALIEVKP